MQILVNLKTRGSNYMNSSLYAQAIEFNFFEWVRHPKFKL